MRPHPSSQKQSAHGWDDWIDSVAACPWPAHVGARPHANEAAPAPLYTPEERRRRDASMWTIVQGVLAPLQFAAFIVSAWLVASFLTTGHFYEIAVWSVVIKTAFLYTIMITGSIWEKDVFGKWLFAKPFFWEDVFSMLVIALHTAYLAALAFGWGSPQTQMAIALCAYAAYVINAAQFLLKLRAARLEQRDPSGAAPPAFGSAA